MTPFVCLFKPLPVHPPQRPRWRWAVLLAAVMVLAANAGCGSEPGLDSSAAVTRDVQYVLDKLATGTREERTDALKLLIDDRSLYVASENLLRQRVFVENDLFLREQMIDGLAVMAVDRLYGPAQVKRYGLPRTAAADGHVVPLAPPADDPTVEALARLVLDDNPYVLIHARAARTRLGVRDGLRGLIIGLQSREETPELADLNLILLRQVTGLHMTADPEEWWPLYQAFTAGMRYTDPGFATRTIKAAGL